jgi:tRNA pseudouridine55 synthase
VEIQVLELLEWGGGKMRVRVECSAGTYIRSLARDIGQKIGCGAFLTALDRTRSGSFHRSSAIPLSEMSGSWRDRLIPLENLLPHLPCLDLDESIATRVRHGNAIKPGSSISTPYCRLFHAGHLIAIGRASGDLVHPDVVLDPLA